LFCGALIETRTPEERVICYYVPGTSKYAAVGAIDALNSLNPASAW